MFAKFIEIVRPRLHHRDALGPKLGRMQVSSANIVLLLMRQLAFDGVRIPCPFRSNVSTLLCGTRAP